MGRLIVVEGIDGSGKTSQSKALAELLKGEWRRFPNRETPFGRAIDLHLREVWKVRREPDVGNFQISDSDERELDGLVFQAVQIANRVEFAHDFRETLKTKHIVCDRYWPSGFAYGGADGLSKQYMKDVHMGLLQADLYVLFDIEVEEAFKRMGARDGGKERYEGNRDFLKTVRDNYRELWESNASQPNWVKVNANGTREEVWAQLKDFAWTLVRDE